MAYIFDLRSSGQKDVEIDIAKDLILYWVSCTVFTLSYKTFVGKVIKIARDYKYLKDYPNAKKGNKYWEEFDTFKNNLNRCLDIIGDPECIEKLL